MSGSITEVPQLYTVERMLGHLLSKPFDEGQVAIQLVLFAWIHATAENPYLHVDELRDFFRALKPRASAAF